MVPPAAQVRGAAGERVDPCWDPRIPGRLFCSWNHHCEVEARGTEEEQQQHLLADDTAAPWNRGGFHRGDSEDRSREAGPRPSSRPDAAGSNPDLAPTFMSFLQKLCQSRVHRAKNMR